MADWSVLADRLEAAADGRRLPFYRALLRRGRDSEAAGRSAAAWHCRKRIEAFLAADSVPARAPRASAGSGGLSPLHALGDKLALLARRRGEELYRRHGNRLPPAARTLFEKALESGDAARLRAERRRLLRRLLRGRARPAPSPWRHLLGDSAPGPYNDRAMVAEVLRRADAADPGWTRALSDLYVGMERLRRSFKDLLPGKG